MSSPAEEFVKERNRRFRLLFERIKEKVATEIVIDGKNIMSDELASMLKDISVASLFSVKLTKTTD